MEPSQTECCEEETSVLKCSGLFSAQSSRLWSSDLLLLLRKRSSINFYSFPSLESDLFHVAQRNHDSYSSHRNLGFAYPCFWTPCSSQAEVSPLLATLATCKKQGLQHPEEPEGGSLKKKTSRPRGDTLRVYDSRLEVTYSRWSPSVRVGASFPKKPPPSIRMTPFDTPRQRYDLLAS